MSISINQSYHIRLLKFSQHVQPKHSRRDPLSLMGFCWLLSAEFLAQHVQCSQFPNTALLALQDASATFILEESLLYQLCYRKSVFPRLFVTDCSLWLWLAIRCFYLNKQISSPSFPQDVLRWSTSDWDKMTDTCVFNKWHRICSSTSIKQSLDCDFRVSYSSSKTATRVSKNFHFQDAYLLSKVFFPLHTRSVPPASVLPVLLLRGDPQE